MLERADCPEGLSLCLTEEYASDLVMWFLSLERWAEKAWVRCSE